MGSDSERFDAAPQPLSAGSSSSAEGQPDAVTDPFAAIGYEAADPSLQSALWRETMQSLPNQRGSR
jgi:hypothetical protein